MPGIGRFRRKENARVYGQLFANGVLSDHIHPLSAHECTDIIGDYGQPHPLSVYHDAFDRVGTLTTRPGIDAFATHTNWAFENQAFYGGHNIDPVLPSDTAVITETMAKTNPSRPEVSLPQFIGELRDIPAMLHLKGLRLGETNPGKRYGYRNYETFEISRGRVRRRGDIDNSAIEQNFGWLPLIQDLLAMADFTAHVDRRLVELEALHSKKGLSRGHTSFSTQVWNREPDTYFNSSWGAIVIGFVTYTGSVRKWGSVNWIPEVPFNGTKGELKSLARHLVHGWDRSPGALASTMWELIPWSWFIDYFGNIGDYLAANRNGANALASMGCVMKHQKTVAQQVITGASSHIITSAGRHTIDQKSRVLATAGLSSTVPFLSIRQLVTMSSLAQSLGNNG